MRREHDFYPTPAWATRELLSRMDIAGDVLEPCAGKGDIAYQLSASPRVSRLRTNDLDVNRHFVDTHDDATDARWWTALPQHDWVVSNFPFVVADKILPLACAHTQCGPRVAVLLRLSYLEPCEGRGAWLAENPPHKLIVLPRISFTGDGKTDSVTCAWFIWNWAMPKTERGIEIVNPVDERQASLLEQPA